MNVKYEAMLMSPQMHEAEAHTSFVFVGSHLLTCNDFNNDQHFHHQELHSWATI